jgi:hypothetical protein
VKHDRRAAGADDIQACPLSSGPFVFGRRDRRTWCNDHPLKIAWQVGEYDEGGMARRQAPHQQSPPDATDKGKAWPDYSGAGTAQ